MRTLIAITGKIGSGKSTVGAILREKNFPVLDCDKINAELLRDDDYIEALHEVFPEAFLNDTFDKRALSQVVFSDEEKRKKLNEMAHPLIFLRLEKEAEQYDGTVFCEVPVLFGTGKESLFDEIWVVESKENNTVSRVFARDGRSTEEIKNILSSQENTSGADVAIVHIENDGTIDELREQIERLLCRIK